VQHTSLYSNQQNVSSAAQLENNLLSSSPRVGFPQSEVGSMGKPVSVVKLYKSGGVAQRSTSSRQQARSARIKEYFYGADGALQPVSVDLDATNMRVFRSGEGLQVVHPIGWFVTRPLQHDDVACCCAKMQGKALPAVTASASICWLSLLKRCRRLLSTAPAASSADAYGVSGCNTFRGPPGPAQQSHQLS
jgi:hypothetical protein